MQLEIENILELFHVVVVLLSEIFTAEKEESA